ncbi:GNAT family N-acetyltransferase [Aestuariibacter halophilus]|uniref:GNAT family N-acetyltransferase n=1 Tax=Fluctibacter halophilus TaxID=226011 RepID=A0ABS8G332_9ALTE|nr:GNAT family N-acetyltransferase [Aestuariibacter halophilus]MCC2614873.1 GNAT family N-acetyltransferase [Aestuariibacter halophilus]
MNKPIPQRKLSYSDFSDFDSDRPVFLTAQWFVLFSKLIPQPEWSSGLIATKDEKVGLPLRVKGNQAESLTNYYSSMFDVLGCHSKDDICRLIEENRKVLSAYSTINFLPLREEQVSVWKEALSQIGFKAEAYFHTVNWFEDGICGVEDYWARRPSRLKNTVKRKTKKLDKDPEYHWDVGVPETLAELQSKLKDYHSVYNDSWKQEEPHLDFINQMLELAWHLGQLRVGVLYHKNQAVAAQVWFVQEKTAYIFKLAYRNAYHGQSVGTVLSAAIFNYVIEKDSVTCIDFLTGDDDYKKDWMGSKRSLFGLICCNTKSLSGQVAWFKQLVSKKLKKHGNRD